MKDDPENEKPSWGAVEKKLTSNYWQIQVFANLIGIVICFLYFAFFYENQSQVYSWSDNLPIAVIMSILLIIIGRIVSRKWMKEIFSFVENKRKQILIPKAHVQKAEQKILNLPVASAIISLFNWSLAAVVMPFFFVIRSFIVNSAQLEISSFFWVAIGIGISGIVTSVMVFFFTELLCRSVWEKFFPNGELIHIRGVFRVNLRPRILIIFLMASLFPMIDMAVVSYQKAQMMLTADPAQVLSSLLLLILFLLCVEMSLVFALSMFMSRSIVAPVLDLKTAMRRVAKADFHARAKVVDNNELGALSQHFNQMTHGLEERYELLQTLAMAKEVQQNLLPKKTAVIDGFDMAAKSLYCDQTGGDYFDFIEARIEGRPTQIIVIGDVSGHGIPSALLMASARAFLRQRLALAGSLEAVLNDVNVQFSKDVGMSGRFMTLFLCALDLNEHTFKWIRAGHDPALFFDPKTDRFTELKQGGGIPLGVDETFTYQENKFSHKPFESGQILFMGTDGIWESCNEAGQMFGKDRLKQIIRNCKNATAHEMMAVVSGQLDQFMGTRAYSDDVTMVIIKKQSSR